MGLIVQSWVRNTWAVWAARMALFAIQLFVVTFLLHRVEIVPTPLSLGLLTTAAGIAILGGLAATVAFVQIWQNGGRGGLRSSFAFGIALLTIALPASYIPGAMKLPTLNDVSTDLVSPPRIAVLAKAPVPTGFMSSNRKGPQSELQRSGYPDLQPVIVTRKPAAAFDAARTIAAREGLDIILETPPRGGNRNGVIQAIDETIVMGFRDDVVIRLQPQGEQIRIDIRSASRYGQHDFGRNAARVRRLARLLRARLDFALPARLEEEAVTSSPKVKKKSVRRAKTKRRPPRVRKKRRRRSRSTARGARARKALQRE